MKYAWLAVPVVLIVVLGAVLYTSQPKQNPVLGSKYVDVNGDEYLRGTDYISSPEDELLNIPPGTPSDFVYPAKLSDCEKVDNEYGRDSCYMLYAQRTGDEAACGAAKGTDARDSCYLEVAIGAKKPVLCEKLTFGKEECYMFAAVETNNAGLCEKSRGAVEQCSKAVDSGKIGDCPLTDEKHYCGEAVTNKDKSLCSKMREFDEYCYLQIALKTNNSSLCNKAGVSRDHCFFSIATKVNNAAICENLTETRDNCIAWVAFNTKNKELCYKAGAEAQSCIEDIETEYGR